MKKGHCTCWIIFIYPNPFLHFFALVFVEACASHLDTYSPNSFSVISLYNIRTASEIYPNIQYMF